MKADVGLKKTNGDWQKISKGQGGSYLNSITGTWRPLSISSLDFINLPFHLIAIFTNTPDMVTSGWDSGLCMLGHCTFEGGGGKCQGLPSLTLTLSESISSEPNLLSEVLQHVYTLAEATMTEALSIYIRNKVNI